MEQHPLGELTLRATHGTDLEDIELESSFTNDITPTPLGGSSPNNSFLNNADKENENTGGMSPESPTTAYLSM